MTSSLQSFVINRQSMTFYHTIFGVDIYEKSIENKKCYLWNEEIELWNFYLCILV